MMRPPVQKSALQQNEAHRLQHHQHTHKHLQQQKQLQQQPDIIATNIADLQQTETIGKKSKLEQRELLVENHLNSACFAQVHAHQQQRQQNQQQQPISRETPLPPHSLPTAPRTIARKSLPDYYNDCYQQQQAHQPHQRTLLTNSGSENNRRDSCATIELLDLSTSPPSINETLFQTQTTSAEVLQNCIPSLHSSNNSQQQQQQQQQQQLQRFSFASQYSSRSSSSDDSSSLSLTTGSGTGSGTLPAVVAGAAAANYSSSYRNTFDDAAENFIINFPADTLPLAPIQSSLGVPPPSDYCLPLSETEPLLTNIEATVNDKQRSIYLNKNSASLIFTRKDLSATLSNPQSKAAPTYQQHHCKSQLQSKTNNNFNGTAVSGSKTLPGIAAATENSCVGPTTVRRQNHSTLRSFSEENYKRKPTKHLPATYHQQHRHSLQLNYNNNLVTTTTCGAFANNNHCCGGSSTGTSTSGGSKSFSACSFNSNSAVLHKTHHSYRPQQQQQQKPQQQQQQKQAQTNLNSNSNNCTTANNTAAATRKQYAYSWYAPVYSALEEELEQDSRDSSPIHNLANTKKQHIHQYHQTHNSNSLLAATNENETEALIESRQNSIIETHLPSNSLKRESIAKQLHPTKLSLQNTRNSSGKRNQQLAKGIASSSGNDIATVEEFANYELEGPHAGSLGLAGGPQPRRIRFGNFLKSLVGLRPSVSNRNSNNGISSASNSTTNASHCGEDTPPTTMPSSPEITVTRTPSEQNMVVMRDPSGYREYDAYSSREKLANERVDKAGSTSSLNVMQQKLWNIVRREGSAISLHQEKSHSIVHYTGLRKCETVLALTRQTATPCSPTMGAGAATSYSRNRLSEGHSARLSHTGSGIFSATGVEQIRPLNRLRNSISSMNNTCSRCSSLLSLAASSSRYSLSNSLNPMAHTSQQYLRNSSNISSSNISSTFSRSRDESVDAGLHFTVKRNSRISAVGSQRNSNSGTNSIAGSRTPSMTSPTTTTATTASTIKLTTPPTDNSLSVPLLTPPPHNPFVTSPVPAPAPAPILRESVTFPTEASLSTPLTVTSLLRVSNNEKEEASNINEHQHKFVHGNDNDNDVDDDAKNGDCDVIDGVYKNNSGTTSGGSTMNKTCSPSSSSSANCSFMPTSPANVTLSTNPMAAASSTFLVNEPAAAALLTTTPTIQHCSATNDLLTITNAPDTPMQALALAPAPAPARPFQMFTCKLCLIDVDDATNSTTLHQCSCHFCTECMKAYVEFEISEGAYEISCPDAQCLQQGVMTLPEIANLTTNNLMKKHHRYRLNREIELDKTRTWCPRAGCETVCLIGPTTSQSETAVASTSASSAEPTVKLAMNSTTAAATPNATSTGTTLCAVLCPSCKDEFCSACKKAWHPNITCEEYGRRLAADGQDDIGIPFDNDLIKCCPMCAVPIEKDEGCAQMMCKRCKHVFCWYCLASLDDDFLLRHYDKGPCKNKLGHSRASVVWHRAQVIGIFAGFGILLLVASPLLLLAAPCIICCKCRSCSGSKIDEGDGEMEEATALQSLN